MYLKSRIEEVVALLVPERPVALPPPLDETGKTIMFAADLLRRYGWCQGAWFNADGRMCAMGALYHAIVGHPGPSTDSDNHPAIRRVIHYLGGTTYDGRGVVERWNDTPGRKAGAVIAMLECAARSVR